MKETSTAGFIFIIIIISLLVLMTAFFATSELSLAASRQTRLQKLAKNQIKVERVKFIKKNPGDYFTVVQIGLNLIAVFAGAIGETLLSPYFYSFFSLIISNNHVLSSLSTICSILFITAIFIIFADLIPKKIAINFPERTALTIITPMWHLIRILKPLIFLFDGIASFVISAFGVKNNNSEEITTDDIHAVVNAGAEAGLLITQEHQLIENVFDLKSNTVTDVMTSHDSVVFYSDELSIEEVIDSFDEVIHQRVPIYHEEMNNVIGYVNVRSLLALYLQEGNSLQITDKRFFKQALFVPDTLLLYEVLDYFKQTGEDFSIVLNEYGLVVGIVTLKDVMSIVMGDLIHYDDDLIIKRDDNSWLISGMAPIKDVTRILEIDNLFNQEYYETMSGFVMYLMRKIPKIADKVEFGNYIFEIVSMENHIIKQMIATKKS